MKSTKLWAFLVVVMAGSVSVQAQIQPNCDTCTDPYIQPTGAPSPVGGILTDRAKPSNQTGLGTVFSATVATGGAATVQGSSSYTYSVPMFSKPGRAGMDLNLTLYYNSHIWLPDIYGGMMMGFDRNTPSPGFQLNFGFLEWNPASNFPAGILTTPDGAKHSLAINVSNLVPTPPPVVGFQCANQICLYDTDDSSYINVARPLGTIDGLPCLGPNNCPAKDITVTYKNGTTALYQSFAVVTNDLFDEFVMRPYRIQDSNGNFITISYINNSDLSIDTITDSLGRTLKFNYRFVQTPVAQTPLLSCVTDGASCGAPGSRTYSFSWNESYALGFNFALPGQALIGGNLYNAQSGFIMPVLSEVCRPDTTCVKFNYGDWGIVNDIQELSANGTVRYELSYDFPAAAAGPLSGNPTYTHQVEKMTVIQCPPPGGPPGPICTINGQTNTWTYAFNKNANDLVTSSSITDPGGVTTTTVFSQNGDWQDGLPTQIQRTGKQISVICPDPSSPCPPPAPGLMDTLLGTRNITWTSDLAEAAPGITNGGYPTGINPRPASVMTILEDNSQSQVRLQYDNSAVPVTGGAPQPFTGSGSITDKIETDFGVGAPGPVLRETIGTYTSLGNHILGLPTDIKVKDGAGKVVSHTTMAYDGGTIQSVSPLPVGHENVGYSAASNAPRGNLTSTTMYANPVASTGGVTTTFAYDMLGNKVSEVAGCCTQTAWIYSNNTAFAYPDSVVAGPSGNQLQTSFTYDQNTGLMATTTDWNGQVTSFTYDVSGRLTSSTRPDGVTQTTAYDDNSANPAVTQSNSANSRASIHTVDFLGRALSDQVLNGSTPISTRTYINDSMGRPLQVSNPYAPSETPVYTTYAYDLQGRAIEAIPPALSQAVGQRPYVTTYLGPATMSTDPAGHQSRQYTNSLGQVVRVDRPGPSGGSLASASVALTGTEQSVPSNSSQNGATAGTANITVGGPDRSTVVRTHNATSASVTVIIGGSDGINTFTSTGCTGGPPGRTPLKCITTTAHPADQGTIQFSVNAGGINIGPISTSYSGSSTSASLAAALAGSFPANGAVGISYAAGSSGFTLTTTAAGVAANSSAVSTSIASSCVDSSTDSTSMSCSQGWTITPSQNFSGGSDNVDTTFYDTGTATVSVTINGTVYSKSSIYSQNTTSAGIAGDLAGKINSDTTLSPLLIANSSGGVLNLTTVATGSGTNYPLALSSATNSQYFPAGSTSFLLTGPAAFNPGQPGTLYDAGTVTATLNGLPGTAPTETVNYSQGSTSAALAASLAGKINSDAKWQAILTANVPNGSSAITITANVQGARANNYSVTLAGASKFASSFPTPSFASPSAMTQLAGGADPGFSGNTPTTTSYTNDPYGRLLQVSTGQQTQTYVYDGLGRMASSTTPETAGLPVTYTYTDFGAVARKTDPRVVPGTNSPVMTTYAYDSLNRIAGITYNDNVTPNVTYVYNAPNSANNTGGRLASASSSVETKAYQYDVMGRITQCLETIGANQYVVNYAYAADGQMSSITYPSQLKVNYSYDPIGRLTQLGTATQNILSINPADYNAAGAPQTVTYGNNIKGTFGFNNQLQISSIQYGAAAPASPLFSLTYLYGGSANNGQIQGITDNVDATHSTGYQYDALGRLQTAQTVNLSPNSWQLTFAYDIYGNRLSEIPTGGTGSMPSNYVVVDPTTNRIQGSGTLYDAAGNMVSDGLNNNVFNADNQLLSTNPVPGLFIGGPSTFSYGPDGALVNRNLTNFIYAGGQVIAEYPNGAAASSPGAEYINLGGQQLATVAGGAFTFNFADHLSTRVTADLSANPVRTYGHFPAGETFYQTGVPSDFQFTSYGRDANSGLDYANARIYSSRLGRFLSPDPVLGGGFAYASSDPVNLVDPTGLEGCTTNPFDGRPLPLCGPDQLGNNVGFGASCGFSFGDNLSFDFTFTSNCKSFSLNFNNSLTSGPFGSYKDTLTNILQLVLPRIETCQAEFECPENGAPLFGDPQCDPQWCAMDFGVKKNFLNLDTCIKNQAPNYSIGGIASLIGLDIPGKDIFLDNTVTSNALLFTGLADDLIGAAATLGDDTHKALGWFNRPIMTNGRNSFTTINPPRGSPQAILGKGTNYRPSFGKLAAKGLSAAKGLVDVGLSGALAFNCMTGQVH